MDPAIPISLSIGFSLRIFLLTFDRQSPLRPTFVGIWEGIALYRGLSTSGPQKIDSYLPCAFRLLVDFFFTENVHTMITLIFSLVLAFLISDVVNSYHGHDAQVNRRSSVKRKPGNPIGSAQIYEISDSPRMNRIRFISPMIKPDLSTARIPPVVQTIRPPNNRIVDFVVRADHICAEDQPRSSSSHGPAHAPDSPSLVPTPITPPCTPPKRILPPHPREDIPTCNSGSPQDELQTPPILIIPQPLVQPDFDAMGVGQPPANVGDAAQDELQTPLTLNLRDLPLLTLEEAQPQDGTQPLLLEDIPLLGDPTSVLEPDRPGVDGDNVSEVSLLSGTELSIISANNAQMISAKAELLRTEAWGEEGQIRRLKEQLDQAVSQKKIKDAFLLRREIEAVEERARKLHGRAARRHFRARNLSHNDGIIDVHGLFVAEAVKKVETALQTAIWDRRKELRVIVGRGLHSQGRRPKLRPAIMDEMQRQSIPCRIQTDNPGVLILSVPS